MKCLIPYAQIVSQVFEYSSADSCFFIHLLNEVMSKAESLLTPDK